MEKQREDLKAIYTAAIEAVNPEAAVHTHLKLKGSILFLYSGLKPIKEYDIDSYEKIIVVGSGKATAPMAKAVENILGNRISEGLITVKYGYLEELSTIKTIEADHPVPDANGVKGATMIRSLLESAGEHDLVISLISGGGSALLPLPPDTITLDEKRETTNVLLKSGATIHEINAVRKHLSQVKGGNLARAAHPAEVINIMISDVVGDDMDVIASGPFIPDQSTFTKSQEIFRKYNLENKIPKSVLKHITEGAQGTREENPKEDDPIFKKITNVIGASNIMALEAAKVEAENRGYNTQILSSMIEGETRDIAFFHAAIARELHASGNPLPRPACIISGGETTVTVTGSGLGGRNMEFALHAALHIKDYSSILLASIGTDGSDGPTDAAGALADGSTVKRAEKMGIDIGEYVSNNDAYHFFEKLGDLIITGPTNTNVMDMRIIMVV